MAFAATSWLFDGVRLDVVMAGRDDRESAEGLTWAREMLATRPEATVTLSEGKAEDVIASAVARTDAGGVLGARGCSSIARTEAGNSAWAGQTA